MGESRSEQVETLLRRHGPMPARHIGEALGVSQPTVSRALATAGERVVRIGRARATRYVLARDIGRAGTRWPLYRIGPDALAVQLGEIRALAGDGFHFEPSGAMPAFLHGEFSDGLFPGLPWLLDDQRPQGFLGRMFVQHVARRLGAPDDLLRWGADDIVLGLLHHGHDQPGDLVLGDAALQAALQLGLSHDDVLLPEDRQGRYPQLAEAALRGELAGSSAGGEQPKFLANVHGDEGVRSLIVKFSERTTTPAGRRWGDLLQCEHIAATVLCEHRLPAAGSQILEASGRVFLESTRFDRTPLRGRRGFVSLAALDAAFHGHGRIDWWRYAQQLQDDGWLRPDDAHRLRVMGWFGALIGNTDMHLGNAALTLSDTRPLALAPAYDMLPMLFRPAGNGEVVERTFTVVPPVPGQHAEWSQAAHAAVRFWALVADCMGVSGPFRGLAARCGDAVARALARYGQEQAHPATAR